MTDLAPINDAQLLMQFSHLYRRAVDDFMEREGLHRGQALLLCAVAARDGRTQSEIATELSVKGATVTNMLQRLEESRLVTRQRDGEDNRLVRVYITEAGQALETSLAQQLASLEAQVLAGINMAERETLRRLVWRMIDNMNAID